MPNFPLHGPPVRFFMGLVCVLSLWNTAGAVSGLKGEVKKEKGMAFPPATVSGHKGVRKEKDGALLSATVSVLREERKEKGVELLATTELPAWSVDLSALNLTELVNGMLRRALKADSKKFFSLLSITSYSSFTFHKVSVAIYNISNPKSVDPAKFPTRYCYCLNNRTNDLSDFTALLVDIVGNSTSYLTEIFKSTSILSVSQTNESDCVFICVMAGKSGRNLSDFWEMVEKSPVFNYTFTSDLSSASGAATRETRPTTQRQQTLPSSSPEHWTQSTQGPSALRTFPRTEISTPSEVTGRLSEPPAGPTAPQRPASHIPPSLATRKMEETPWVTDNRQTWPSTLSMPRAQTMDDTMPGGPLWESQASTPTAPAEAQQLLSTGSLLDPTGIQVTFSGPVHPGTASAAVTPGTQTPNPTKAPAPREPQTGCPQPLLKEGIMTGAPLPLVIQKLNPCLMELCRYFQKCLCVGQRKHPSSEAMRYCLEHYSWFLKNATLICQRVKKVSHSQTLKQKCLENVCKSV